MTTSDATNEIVAALVAARKKFKPFVKDNTANVDSSRGASYSYKYGDLASLIEATADGLDTNGLTIIQAPSVVDGEFYLVTRLAHTSGQWMQGLYPVGRFERPQEQGSHITYARRYARAAILDIAAEEDDDGAGAEQGTTAKDAAKATKVKEVKVEPTRNAAVTRYVAQFMDGRKAATIKNELGELLRKHAHMPLEDRPLVHAVITRGQYGNELIELNLQVPPPDQAF